MFVSLSMNVTGSLLIGCIVVPFTAHTISLQRQAQSRARLTTEARHDHPSYKAQRVVHPDLCYPQEGYGQHENVC